MLGSDVHVMCYTATVTLHCQYAGSLFLYTSSLNSLLYFLAVTSESHTHFFRYAKLSFKITEY